MLYPGEGSGEGSGLIPVPVLIPALFSSSGRGPGQKSGPGRTLLTIIKICFSTNTFSCYIRMIVTICHPQSAGLVQ